MGGPRRTRAQSVDALEEAIAILRGFWSGQRSVDVDGKHYRVKGAKPGPPPAHPISIWVGAYGPRMLRLTGRLADAWLPSIGGSYMQPDDAPRMHAAVSDGATAAGRDPADIERAANVTALDISPRAWLDQLARVVDLGFTTLLVALPADDAMSATRQLGEEIAPRLRERFQ
jgi:alkanesulfonate monooxygenase SsuD/methylene tetrahydromethanopterin reductase-like flavin-dependent oxidoreductase (luciferase family)